MFFRLRPLNFPTVRLVDMILPFIFALADRDSQLDRMELVREMYTGYGRQASNSVIQSMTNLLFGDTPKKKVSIDRAIIQQDPAEPAAD